MAENRFTPNYLTFAQMLLAPVFLVLLLLEAYLLATLVFLAAAVTDFLDGYFARKSGQVTVSGKLLDSIADKTLTTLVLLGFVHMGWCNFMIPVVILAREYLLICLRLVSARQGTVIPANHWGKAKTACQMIFSLILLICAQLYDRGIAFREDIAVITLPILGNILMGITALLALLSGASYFTQGRKLFETPESRKLLSAILYEEFVYPLLISSALLYFMSAGLCNVWTVTVVLLIGFAVSSFILVAVSQHAKLSLKRWNAAKLYYMLGILLLFLAKLANDFTGALTSLSESLLPLAGNILLGLLAALSLFSGFLCIAGGRKRIDFSI